MEQLRIVYRILRILQKTMEDEAFDRERISADTLGITDALWKQLMAMLASRGYIEGVRVIRYDREELPRIRYTGRPLITLEGLEYLEENSVMKRMAQGASGIADIVESLKP